MQCETVASTKILAISVRVSASTHRLHLREAVFFLFFLRASAAPREPEKFTRSREDVEIGRKGFAPISPPAFG
jgi:hypothetical protein